MSFPSTPPSERLLAPYADVSLEELAANAGKVVAVDRYGAGILESADTISQLRALMEQNHPDTPDYRTLPVPNP